MSSDLNNIEIPNPISSLSKTNPSRLIIRAFQELKPVIPDRFEEYNKSIDLPIQENNTQTFSQDDELISYYSLTIEKRHSIIQQAINHLETDSNYPPDYYAITLVQSFCSILLQDINSIKFEILFDFLNGFRLGWSCLPLHQDLCANIFMIFYTRFLINSEKNYLMNHLMKVDKIGSEFSHCLYTYTPCFIDSCNFIFNIIFQDEDKKESNFNDNVTVLSSHFAFTLKSINWKVIEASQLSIILFDNIIKSIPLIRRENISIAYQFLSFVAYSMQPTKSDNSQLENQVNKALAAITDLIEHFIKESQEESSILPIQSSNTTNDENSFKMKEPKYFELLTDETLEVSNDINLKDYEFDPNLFNSLFDKKNSIIGIIVDFFNNISNLYSLPKTSLRMIIQICKPKIESGDLNFQAILQLYVYRESKNFEKLCTFFEDNHLLNTILFNQFLFDKSISLFDSTANEKPDNKVLMRIHLFSMIQKLVTSKQKPTEIINSIIFLLNFYIGSCQIFTEILFLLNQFQIFSVFPEDSQLAIIELISSEFSVQQQWHIFGGQNAGLIRPIFLKLTSDIAVNFNWMDAMLHSKDFVKSFFSLIFEPEIFSILYEILCILLSSNILSNEGDLFTYFQPLFQTAMRSMITNFNQILFYEEQENPDIDEQTLEIRTLKTLKVFYDFCIILKFFINDGTSNFISLFVKYQLFDLFTNIIQVLPIVTPSSDTETIKVFESLISVIIDVFEKFAFSPMVKKNYVPYNLLIKPIQNLKITEELYNKLKKQVSYPHTQFRSIERPEILPLFLFSTLNTDYFPELLNEIAIMCRDSIWNCFSVFNSGILIDLIEEINLNPDQSFNYTTLDQKTYDVLELALNLFCYVNIFVSSRQLLYAFTRLFRVFDDINLKSSQKDQRTITPHIESYMNCFRTVFTIRSHIPSSFIHFASCNDCVEMKSPLTKDLANGFTISTWLLLDVFNDDNNAFSLLLFRGKTTTLSIYLTKSTLCMTFLNGKDVVFKDEAEISFPTLEWFNLTLNYDKEIGIFVFVNGRKKKNFISKPLTFLASEDFQTLQFHGEPDNAFNWMSHCQLSLFALFIGGYNNNNNSKLAADIYKFGAENVYSIASLTNIYALFSAFRVSGDNLINYKETNSNSFLVNSLLTTNIITIGNAKFKGSLINFVASFCQVFESSNGAAFITALWSLIGLKYPDGKEEKRLISWISQVMETVCQYSEISQIQLLRINAVEVISYFIGTLPDERITSELWSCFNRLFKNVTNSNFKKSICSNILFNYNIWLRASPSNSIRIYEEWRYFIQTADHEFWEEVTINFMIDILQVYLSVPEETEDIKSVISTICLCMYDISLQSFTVEDANTALDLCFKVKDTPFLLSILKLFENAFYNNVNINPYLYFDLLIKTVPFIFNDCKDNAKEEIMLLFEIIYEHEKSNILILIDFIHSVLYQKEFRSKNALFLMKQYMAKSLGTNINEFDKTSSFQITSVFNLILAIFSSIFVDEKERISQMTPFLGKISAFPDNQIKVSNELDGHSILILVFYGIIIDPSTTPFISAFLFRSIKNLSLSFSIIDALERLIKIDLTNQSDIFINHCVSLLIANPTIPNRYSYFELFVSKLLCHRKITEFSWLDRNAKNSKPINFYDFLDAANKYSTSQEQKEEQITSPSYIFGCLIQKDQWNEMELAKTIFQLLIILLNEDTSAFNPSLISCFIFCLTNKNVDIASRLPQLSQLITTMGTNFIYEPLLLNLSRRSSNKQLDEFIKKHFHHPIAPNIQLYTKTNEVFDESLNIIKRIINSSIINSNSFMNSSETNESSFNGTIVNFVIDFFSKLYSITSELKEPIESLPVFYLKSVNSDHHWRRLIHKLRNERSPLLSGSLMNKTQHYKRPSYFDFRFRPILLTPNQHFDVHSKASELALQQQKLQESEQTSQSQNEKESEIDLDMLNSMELTKTMKKKDENLLDDAFVLDENIWNAPCTKINVLNKKKGTFSVFSQGYRFSDNTGKTIILKAESVLYIFWRWDLLIPNSVEIFMDNHKSYFFSFIEEVDHSFVTNKLLKISLPNKLFVQTKPSPIEFQNLHLTEKWLDHSLSTFDYIMYLNMFSGRSFLNLSCYPVFPWILVDYASPSMNIHSKPIYRDFKIPVGAMNKQELNRKKERMEAELEAANLECEPELLNRSSFLFQTGYSNQFIVTYYMLRLEPFTTHHISLMDGRFDNPNRLFNSIPDSFMMLITTNSAFRELIPEFFFQPEFLENSDKFNFGMTLKKKIVDNVELPSWSRTPADFINKHILALESEECGSEISNWIDLIWGYKQNGQNAVQADNTFDPHMYPQNHFPETDVRTNHIRELIGQIPLQLFESEHPKRPPKPNRPLPTVPKNFTLNLSGIGNSNNQDSSFVITSLNYECSSLENLKIYSIHKNGKLLMTKFKESKVNLTGSSSFVTSCLMEEVLIPTDPRFIATCNNSTFVCSLNDGNSLLVYNPYLMKNGKRLICEEKPHIAAISCIAVSSNYIVTGGCDASVVLWMWNKKSVNVIAQSVINNDTINAVAVSNEYGIAVSCSRDGIMSIFRLPHLDFVRSINFNPQENQKSLGRRLSLSAASSFANIISSSSSSPSSLLSAHRVIITKGMGTIIVFLKDENEESNNQSTLIRSYTINGRWISSSSIECEVIDAISITSKSMTDYLLVLIDQPMSQELLLIDAHSLNILSTLATNNSSNNQNGAGELTNESKITRFAYHEDAGIIILAYDNLELSFIPFLLP